jgi:hypothetical protein
VIAMKIKTVDALLAGFEAIVGQQAVNVLFAERDLKRFRRTLAEAILRYHEVEQRRVVEPLAQAHTALTLRLENIKRFMGQDNYRALLDEIRLRNA